MVKTKELINERPKDKKKLQKALEDKTREADEYLSQFKYLKADFENYKKRTEREREQIKRFATEKLVVEILEVVDNIERAIDAGMSNDGRNKTILEGVEMTHKQLLKVLEKEGVRPIQAMGNPFDPHKHECVMTEVTDEFDEDTVIQELQKGYTIESKIIRHSKVKISKR